MRSRLVLLAGALVVPFVAACASQPVTTPTQAPESAPAQSVRADVRFGLTPKQVESADARRGNGYLHRANIRRPVRFGTSTRRHPPFPGEEDESEAKPAPLPPASICRLTSQWISTARLRGQ